MYVLLHLALELTDLLLAQLVITRRELESSQYGPFTPDLSTDNQNRGDTRNNDSVDNSLQTESNRTNDNTGRRNTNREKFSRSRDTPSVSGATYRETAEDLFSIHRNRRYRGMAQQLKQLFCHHRGTENVNTSSGSQTSNSVVTRSSDNGDDNNSDHTAQNEDNRQSISENALSAEVQSIVERIQSGGSIDNDSEIRMGVENRTIDAASDARSSNESYRRNHRNATLSERCRRAREVRNTPENDAGTNWRTVTYTSSGDEQNGRSPHQLHPRSLIRDRSLFRWSFRQFVRGENSMRRPLRRSEFGTPGSRRFPYSNEGASLRREFNVPELQVNSVPVTVHDLENLSANLRRRQNTPPTPPHTPPPYLISPNLNSLNSANNSDGRNNDWTNDSSDQPGPSWAAQPNNRNRVQYKFYNACGSFRLVFKLLINHYYAYLCYTLIYFI